jgi:hypothetical protein
MAAFGEYVFFAFVCVPMILQKAPTRGKIAMQVESLNVSNISADQTAVEIQVSDLPELEELTR